MIWRKAACCLFVIVSAVAAPDAQRVLSDQEMLIQLERGWEAAVRSNDTAYVERILADEFIATRDDGSRTDKAGEVALVASFNQQIDSSRMDEFKIQVHGDTAVVWFTLHLIGPVQGQPVEITLRYLDVWVWRNEGGWLCVASQSTRVTG